ncbi:hypothetical protein F5883DRAFT_644367 [Diaporthe sp. PMI_573]|nr:hypothetical protein F5883DRAFT_644367 [Diaporthaceae sp. PMI_573]
MSANRLKKGPHAVNISVACHGVVLGRLVERGVSKIISGVEDGANGGASVPQASFSRLCWTSSVMVRSVGDCPDNTESAPFTSPLLRWILTPRRANRVPRRFDTHKGDVRSLWTATPPHAKELFWVAL